MSEADEVVALDELSLVGDEADAFEDSFDEELDDDSPDDESPDSLEVDEPAFELVGPFADELEARESVIYHPLPLNTIPTG